MTDITHVSTGDDEMAGMAQRFFMKASDAIVQASKLAKVVEDLQAQVASLTARINEVLAESEQLRNELAQVRQERDLYRQQYLDGERAHADTKTAFDAHVQQSTARYEELQGQYDTVTQDYAAQGQRLQDAYHILNERTAEANSLRTRLDEALVKLEAIASIVREPVKEAAPQSDPSAEPNPSPSSSPTSGDEQPRNEAGQFESVPMAAREFSY